MAGALASDAGGQVVYSFGPVLLLFGDDEEGLGLARAAAERAGCRVAGDASLAEGEERLDRQIGVDAALLTAGTPSGAFDALLARIARDARQGRMKGVVAAPAAMIDHIFAADLPDTVEHLVEPSAEQLEAALARATEAVPQRLHDVDRRGGAVLQQLSEEAARIASVLASLSGDEAGEGGADGDAAGEAGGIEAPFVRAIIRARRMRDQYFQPELFADPGFDMLLDLYAARLEGSRVAVSSLCIAASVPATTALRWIKALTDKGLFVRQADPQDGRRVYIALSDDAARAMGRYLAAVQRTGTIAI